MKPTALSHCFFGEGAPWPPPLVPSQCSVRCAGALGLPSAGGSDVFPRGLTCDWQGASSLSISALWLSGLGRSYPAVLWAPS